MSKLNKPKEPTKPKKVDISNHQKTKTFEIDVETTVERLISELEKIEDKKRYLECNGDYGTVYFEDRVLNTESYQQAVDRYEADMKLYREKYKQYILDMTEYINQGGEL